MGDVLRIVHRLRKVQATNARTALAQAEDKLARSHERLCVTEQLLRETTGTTVATEILTMQRRHQGALHLELQRRAQARMLTESEHDANTAQASYASRAREAKVVELVAESRVVAGRVAMLRRESAQLNEQGLISWWRRSA